MSANCGWPGMGCQPYGSSSCFLSGDPPSVEPTPAQKPPPLFRLQKCIEQRLKKIFLVKSFNIVKYSVSLLNKSNLSIIRIQMSKCRLAQNQNSAKISFSFEDFLHLEACILFMIPWMLFLERSHVLLYFFYFWTFFQKVVPFFNRYSMKNSD